MTAIKKMLMGIAIILFVILIELTLDGSLVYISWGIGAVGLAFVIAGFAGKEDTDKNE